MIETPCEKMIEEAIHSVTEGKGKTESGQVPRNDQSKIIKALPLPFAPVHLLFINLLTDSLPAIAIGDGTG